MTVPHDEAEAPPETPGAVPVAVGHDLNVQGQAADYGAITAYSLAGTEQAQPILPFDPFRHRATVMLSPVKQVTSAPNNGLALFTSAHTTPTVAGSAISTLVNPQTGQYNMKIGIYLDGTITAADEDNFQVLYNGATTWNLIYPIPASGPGGLVIVDLGTVSPNGSNSVIVRTLGIPSGTAVYHAEIILTPIYQTVITTPLVYLGSQAQCQQAQAGQPAVAGRLYAGQSVVIENNQQVWMAPDGVNPVIVTVLAERWHSPGN